MLDAQQLAQLVEKEIKTAVAQQVQQAVSQTEWIQDLETQIIGFVQDRITARFSNIGTLPDLVDTVERKVGELFTNGFVPDLQSYIDQDRIRQTIDLAVEQLVEKSIDSLTLDPAWVSKIENLVAQRTEDRIRARMRDIDLAQAVESAILANQDTITTALRKDFRSTGLADQSSSLQLTIMDGVVVIENETVTHDLTVVRNTTLKGDVLIKGSLGVQGRINTDNETWHDLSQQVGEVTYNRIKNDFAKELIDTVIKSTKEGISIDNITVGDSPLVSGDTLSSGITKSRLNQVGVLKNLDVEGVASLAQTLTVKKGRVGINTQEPEHALAIWDEEVSVTAGKHSKDTAFIGTGRRQNLIIGTNRQNHIEVDADGLTTVQRLRVGRNNISWSTEVPNYSGTKGDIVFNINAGGDAPFAWICVGAFRWQAIKVAR